MYIAYRAPSPPRPTSGPQKKEKKRNICRRYARIGAIKSHQTKVCALCCTTYVLYSVRVVCFIKCVIQLDVAHEFFPNPQEHWYVTDVLCGRTHTHTHTAYPNRPAIYIRNAKQSYSAWTIWMAEWFSILMVRSLIWRRLAAA